MAYIPSEAVQPGSIIARILEREGMSQKNLAERTGLSEKHISQVINGEASITIETALLLENVFGNDASFWIGLEKNFQEAKVRIERQTLLKEEAILIKNFPYDELVERGYVTHTNSKEERVQNLWKFFGVNSLQSIKITEAVAFRKKDSEHKEEIIATWLRCGELDARKELVAEFSQKKIKESVNKIKSITTKRGDIFLKTKEILADAGVVIVHTPHFKGSKVNGAMRWLNDRPVIQINTRGKYADIFWFTVMHEIGHIVLHGKKGQFVELNEPLLSKGRKEEEANVFANDTFISKEEYQEFVGRGDFSIYAIHSFAQKLKIDPGIVAGRLCHENKTNWQKISRLRTQLSLG